MIRIPEMEVSIYDKRSWILLHWVYHELMTPDEAYPELKDCDCEIARRFQVLPTDWRRQ